jgi:sec-independent protein translocase protein TatA
MGLDNPLHIAFLLVILLLIFGAKRLPELGRSLGTGMRSFKDSISGESHTEHAEQLPAPSPVAAASVRPSEPVAEHRVPAEPAA